MVQIFNLLVANIDRSFIMFSYVQCIHQHSGASTIPLITHHCDTTRETYIPPAITVTTVSHLTNQHCGATRVTYIPPATGSTGVIYIFPLLLE